MAHILVVEDDGAISDLLHETLSDEGHTVSVARNGEEGKEIALKEHPQLILADIAMPVLTGVEMLRAIRTDDWGKSVKVIMITNLEDDKNMNACLELGVRYYWMKSRWDTKELFTHIDNALKEEA